MDVHKTGRGCVYAIQHEVLVGHWSVTWSPQHGGGLEDGATPDDIENDEIRTNLVASTSLDHVLLPECHEYVQKYDAGLPEWEPKPVSSTVKWTETLTPGFLPKPEQIQQHPGRKAFTLRQVDILLEQDRFSSGCRPPATNGSQNKNRCVREGVLANCPTRACQILIPQRQRFLLGPEAIRLQLALDHKKEDEVVSNFIDSERMQLAGNAFNATTVNVVLLAVLMTTSSLVQ